MRIENKISFACRIVLVLFLASLSIAAWWGGGGKKNIKKETPEVSVQKASVPASVAENSEASKSTAAGAKEAEVQEQSVAPDDKSNELTSAILSPQKQQEETEKIQADLKEIVERTRQLQNQVKDNRSEIQEIMDRARIHEQILRSISLPPPVVTRNQINPDDIIKREKLRLIAEQAKQTQEQLRVMQQVRSIDKAAPIAPTGTKVSKTS